MSGSKKLMLPIRILRHDLRKSEEEWPLLPDEPLPRGGEVYFLRAACGTKIGCAVDARKRVSSYAATLPFESEIVHIIKTDDCYGLEHLFHYRFCQKHIRAEWFALTDEDIAFIRTLDGPPPRPFPEDHPDNIEVEF